MKRKTVFIVLFICLGLGGMIGVIGLGIHVSKYNAEKKARIDKASNTSIDGVVSRTWELRNLHDDELIMEEKYRTENMVIEGYMEEYKQKIHMIHYEREVRSFIGSLEKKRTR